MAAVTGWAVVTTFYFSQQAHHHGGAHSITISIAVVGAITALCPGLADVREAPAEEH